MLGVSRLPKAITCGWSNRLNCLGMTRPPRADLVSQMLSILRDRTLQLAHGGIVRKWNLIIAHNCGASGEFVLNEVHDVGCSSIVVVDAKTSFGLFCFRDICDL